MIDAALNLADSLTSDFVTLSKDHKQKLQALHVELNVMYDQEIQKLVWCDNVDYLQKARCKVVTFLFSHYN